MRFMVIVKTDKNSEAGVLPAKENNWMYFIAEHDDHHLAQAHRVLVAAGQRLSLQAKGN